MQTLQTYGQRYRHNTNTLSQNRHTDGLTDRQRFRHYGHSDKYTDMIPTHFLKIDTQTDSRTDREADITDIRTNIQT